MKTLNNITTGENTGFHFESPANGISIAKWIKENLDKFNLNEPHSCKVTHFKGDITISGDEDLVLLVVEDLKLIKLKNPYHIIQNILLKKSNGVDCTESESAEIKMFLKENIGYVDMNENEIRTSEGFQVREITRLFPCETSEALDEMGL